VVAVVDAALAVIAISLSRGSTGPWPADPFPPAPAAAWWVLAPAVAVGGSGLVGPHALLLASHAVIWPVLVAVGAVAADSVVVYALAPSLGWLMHAIGELHFTRPCRWTASPAGPHPLH
jgi:hypothetical protein